MQRRQATAFVHQAWLRLGDGEFNYRSHFFAAAAEAMRRILVESARRRASGRKRGQASGWREVREALRSDKGLAG